MIPETEQQLAIEDELRHTARVDDESSELSEPVYRLEGKDEDEEELVNFAEVKFEEAPAPDSAWVSKTGYSNIYLERVAPRLPVEKIPDPPRLTFLSGVFEFPWKGKALERWSFLSVGCTLTALVLLFLVPTVMGVISGAIGMSAVMLGFFGLPGFWILFWTMSYAAACSLPIVIETSAGADEIDGWPEPQWREWAADLYYSLYLGSIVLAVAWLAGAAVASVFHLPLGGRLAISLLTALVTAPIVLLSSLEASSFWVPLSPAIARSIARETKTWLAFYAVYLGFTLTALAVSLLLARIADLASAVIVGPLLAAVIMIDARLVGRLGWRILGGQPRQTRRRERLVTPGNRNDNTPGDRAQ